jgi:thioredoxin 1
MAQAAFEITSENFQNVVLQSTLPVLVDFTADWCPPCKMIAPYVAELAQKYQGSLVVGSLDADAHPEIIQRYGVMGLPTLIVFQNGEPVKRIVGFQTQQRLEAQVLPYLSIDENA